MKKKEPRLNANGRGDGEAIANDREKLLRSLLGLKRHEKPDPMVFTRVAARVREQVAAHQPETGWQRLLSILAGEEYPAVRYGIAALFVAALALQLLALPRLPTIPGEQAEGSGPELAVNVAPPAGDPVPILQLASNQGPVEVQYGPAPSRLVTVEE